MLLTTKYFKRQFKREEPILLVAKSFAMHEQETVAKSRYYIYLLDTIYAIVSTL